MARTKAEVRAFLDSKVGTIVPHPGYPDLNGQCVTLTKALMEFLGVPNPYAARGNARDAGDTYIRQGIGTEGKGWLTILVNRDMGYIGGVRYGHIWIDLQGEANYESNGNRALYTTKNTRPFTQGQQFINFDKWIGDDEVKIGKEDNWYWRFNRFHHQLVRNGDLPREVFNQIVGLDAWKVLESWSDHPEANQLIEWQVVGERASKDRWDLQIYGLQDKLNIANANLLKAQQQLGESVSKEELAKANQAIADAKAEAQKAREELDAKLKEDADTDEKVNGFFRSLWKKLTGGK
jgi:hypothetical protein